MTSHSAQRKVFAPNYTDALVRIASEMDAIWGENKWGILSCRATAITSMADVALAWEWDFEIAGLLTPEEKH